MTAPLNSSKAATFAFQVKSARESRKLTQTALAAFTGYSVRTVQHWEAGTRIPHPVTQEAILRRIGENASVEARQK